MNKTITFLRDYGKKAIKRWRGLQAAETESNAINVQESHKRESFVDIKLILT
jgi:hypothetical protein